MMLSGAVRRRTADPQFADVTDLLETYALFKHGNNEFLLFFFGYTAGWTWF